MSNTGGTLSIYFIGQTPTVKISGKFPTREDATEFRQRLAPIELIEVGWLSYWFMSRNLPTLAMLPLCR